MKTGTLLVKRSHILIFWNLQVQWSWSPPNPPRDIIMRTMTGTEPSTIVTGLTNGDTTKMGTDSQHDKPLWLLNSVCVSLWIAERPDLDVVGLFDFGGCAVADKDGLATPFDDYVLPFGDVGEVDFDLGHGEDVSRGGHGGEKVWLVFEGGG